jgi:hypothetical protein
LREKEGVSRARSEEKKGGKRRIERAGRERRGEGRYGGKGRGT